MGLIKAAISAASSTLADQWLDYIYCDRMDDNVLMRKGQIKKSGSNTKGTDNIITNGSKIQQKLVVILLIRVQSLQCFMVALVKV